MGCCLDKTKQQLDLLRSEAYKSKTEVRSNQETLETYTRELADLAKKHTKTLKRLKKAE